MVEIRPYDPEKSAHFRVLVYRATCYGGPAVRVAMKFETFGKVTCELAEGSKRKTLSLARAEAENFLAKISAVLDKDEVLSDLGSVVRYHVEIEWENLTFIEGRSAGTFKSVSNEWSIDQIEEFIEYEAESPEIRARFRQILDTNPHRHALEIYDLTMKFILKYRLEMFQ